MCKFSPYKRSKCAEFYVQYRRQAFHKAAVEKRVSTPRFGARPPNDPTLLYLYRFSEFFIYIFRSLHVLQDAGTDSRFSSNCTYKKFLPEDRWLRRYSNLLMNYLLHVSFTLVYKRLPENRKRIFVIEYICKRKLWYISSFFTTERDFWPCWFLVHASYCVGPCGFKIDYIFVAEISESVLILNNFGLNWWCTS